MLIGMETTTWEDQDTTPSDVDGLQVGKATWDELRSEARRMITILENRFADLDLLDFRIIKNPHDFGDYPSIRVRFPETDEGWNQYNHLEKHWPRTWDDTDPVPYTPPAQTSDSD